MAAGPENLLTLLKCLGYGLRYNDLLMVLTINKGLLIVFDKGLLVMMINKKLLKVIDKGLLMMMT